MSSEDGVWYELRPHGDDAAGGERYRDRAAAEQAATAMLIRLPDLAFIEVAEIAMRNGEREPARTVSRIAGAQGPAPSDAEIDDLHKLPRGEPEC